MFGGFHTKNKKVKKSYNCFAFSNLNTIKKGQLGNLKGVCHEIFDLQFFS